MCIRDSGAAAASAESSSAIASSSLSSVRDISLGATPRLRQARHGLVGRAQASIRSCAGHVSGKPKKPDQTVHHLAE
eukprot:7284819-Prymnesium_polylepis.1